MRNPVSGLSEILVGSNSIKFGPTLAATVISVAPLLVLFLFGQKFFMEGIATSGMKMTEGNKKSVVSCGGCI